MRGARPLPAGGTATPPSIKISLAVTSAPVKVSVIVLILLEYRPIERHPGKQASRPRVAKDLGVKLSVRCAFRGTAHGSGRYRNIPAQLDAVLNELSCACGIHHDENHVGSLTADLKSEASAAQGEHRRRPPRTVPVPAAHQHPASISAAHNKGALDLRRNDAHTYGFFEQIMRYAFVGSPHNLIEDVGCLFQLAFLGESRHRNVRTRKTTVISFFISSLLNSSFEFAYRPVVGQFDVERL